MENLNLVELLRDCPTGMELDSTVFDNITFDYVNTQQNRVYCKVGKSESVWFTPKGGVNLLPDAKCVIFPKGKTTWEGFVLPCKFKDGDILTYTSTHTTTFIYRNKDNEPNFSTSFYVACNNAPSHNFLIYNKNTLIALNENCETRLATEEEKQKLFDAIKANGYKWNAETKTLEKLVEPKFKVGDVIVNIYRKHLNGDSRSWKIYQIANDKYIFTDGSYIHIQDQNNWELVPNKFDITTLKPFDKVLYRMHHNDTWLAGFYNVCIKNKIFVIGLNAIPYCIPYEGNQHLLGTTNDCDPYFKTWE